MQSWSPSSLNCCHGARRVLQLFSFYMLVEINFILSIRLVACLILRFWLYINLFNQCLVGHSGSAICTLLKTRVLWVCFPAHVWCLHRSLGKAGWVQDELRLPLAVWLPSLHL